MDPCGLGEMRFQGSCTREMEVGVEGGLPSLQLAETLLVTPRSTFTTNTNLAKVGLEPAQSPTEEPKID